LAQATWQSLFVPLARFPRLPPISSKMAPVKRTAAGSRKGAGVPRRCKLIKEAVEGAEGCTDRVKDMLCSTLPVTIGAVAASRHPFNQKFVTIIGEVLSAEHTRLKKDVVSKEASFADLTPAKAQREQAAESASTDAKAAGEAEKAAKAAVAEANSALKELNTALKEAEKARKAGDADLEVIEGKKAQLVSAKQDELGPLMEGSAGDDTMKKAKVVLDVGKSFDFDVSLLSTAEPVLSKVLAERGSFDNTCLDQLQGAFNAAIGGFDEQLAAGAGGKAERAATVANAEASKAAGEANLASLKENAQAAKAAESSAKATEKSASADLASFMPDLKTAGDNLDEAKEDVKEFEEGALQSFAELKDLKEDSEIFKEGVPRVAYYETIDGMRLDRGIIDACRTAVMGAGDGRVSADDAKKVLEEAADGGRVTSCERWTMRYCLQEFRWTEAAQTWLVEEIKNVKGGQSPAKKAKTGTGYYETVDGFKCDRGIIDTCREAIAGAGDGRISQEDALKVWEKAADGNQVTDAERWTVRYCVGAFNFTESAHDWIMDQLKQQAAPAAAA